MGNDAGRRFGTYTLLEVLGKGATAHVFRAVRSGAMGFRKEVAVKQVLPHVAENSRVIKGLINEARIAGYLRHRNLVEVYEFDQVDDVYYLAMEYVPGWTLAQVMARIGRKGPIPARVVAGLAVQLCDGLAYAHDAVDDQGKSLRLVHRDIKPGNVMVSRGGAVKLMDFGVAKAASNLFATSTADVTKGTPIYMSPEQVRGDPLDGRSDIFSVGSVIAELITGRVVFSDTQLYRVLQKVDRADAEAVLADVGARAPQWVSILRRALARDRDGRFDTADQMAEAVRAVFFEIASEKQVGEWLRGWMQTPVEEAAAGAASAPLDVGDVGDLLESADEGVSAPGSTGAVRLSLAQAQESGRVAGERAARGEHADRNEAAAEAGPGTGGEGPDDDEGPTAPGSSEAIALRAIDTGGAAGSAEAAGPADPGEETSGGPPAVDSAAPDEAVASDEAAVLDEAVASDEAAVPAELPRGPNTAVGAVAEGNASDTHPDYLVDGGDRSPSEGAGRRGDPRWDGTPVFASRELGDASPGYLVDEPAGTRSAPSIEVDLGGRAGGPPLEVEEGDDDEEETVDEPNAGALDDDALVDDGAPEADGDPVVSGTGDVEDPLVLAEAPAPGGDPPAARPAAEVTPPDEGDEDEDEDETEGDTAADRRRGLADASADPRESLSVHIMRDMLASQLADEIPTDPRIQADDVVTRAPRKTVIPKFVRHDHGIELVQVEPAEFWMGSPDVEIGREADELLHRVELSRAYLIGRTAVTQAQWAAVMRANPSWTSGDQHPVESVSWYAAVAYCNRLSVAEGRAPAYRIDGDDVELDPDASGFRLPTEAEWEMAARAGEHTRYAGSDEIDDVAWHWRNTGGLTHPVATRKPNAWGLHDLSGNVSEWVWDGYAPYPSLDRVVDPRGPRDGELRIHRGGSAFSLPGDCRTARRHGEERPSDRYNFLGFRLARNAD